MATKVKISVRMRPFLPNEAEDGAVEITPHSCEADGSILVSNSRDAGQGYRFNFGTCWDQSTSQEALFERDVRPLIEQVYNGFTACIFCYGVTSSGKTHTMQGSKSEPGIIPRVIRALLNGHSHTTSEQAGRAKTGGACEDGRTVQVLISYMEIYKDDVYDLLVTRADAPKLQIREGDGKTFVANLTETPVDSLDSFERLFSVACKSRSTGATLLNRASSRSHAILGIRVQVTDLTDGTKIEGKINLIDLAGSENNNLTGNDSSRMQESSAINKSLSVLGQVVDALNRGLPRVPYRDSKLTRILRDALGGSCLSLLICNIAPGYKFIKDTHNTLKFASRTSEIENRAVANGRHSNAQAPALRVMPNLGAPVRTSRPLSAANAGPCKLSRLSGDSITSEPPSRAQPLTEEEMKDQIAKAVAAEVKRQMEQQISLLAVPPATEATPAKARTGRSKDKEKASLAEELRKRVEKLEEKNTSADDENMAQILSPDGKKKLAQALIVMARAAQDKGQLEKALDYYQRALQFVRHNAKLQLRIDEVTAALEEGKTVAQFKRDRAARVAGNAVGSEEPAKPPKSRVKRKRARDDSDDEDKENQSIQAAQKKTKQKGRSKRLKSDNASLKTPSPRVRSSSKALALSPDTDGKAPIKRSIGLGSVECGSSNVTDNSVEVIEVDVKTPAPFGRRVTGKVRKEEEDWVPES